VCSSDLEIAQIMLTDVLRKVVTEGTGRLADMEEYEIAGKTGTAQKLVNGEYSHNKYVSSFICTGPIADPRVIVLIVVNEPTRGASFYGGTAAAPYASEVLKETLDYMLIDQRRRATPVDIASAKPGSASDIPEGDHAP
jgi:cell division protein FtsI/penicillin-binding protein 2